MFELLMTLCLADHNGMLRCIPHSVGIYATEKECQRAQTEAEALIDHIEDSSHLAECKNRWLLVSTGSMLQL